ncbi:acetoin utilization protein AcuC [Planosporangium flavigriseum]|uniref:Acetoin utilization protein AcuC n=1 Tax=Planosporangium flavigriseum TaxID=373681 RepID=A0A8J3LH39_9ACTN|nr:acetoin utilization protein AcuC [Planosporangium flavigriseum]NJC63974.1 acetoin utilization protein AcuC [Planosporangium flavigriseum]GIG72852.1 acetoin utilization protein AcuC [Planosporangium flavigriseum]
MTDTTVVWNDALLGYDMGEHPLNPVRVELTMALAGELGVLDRPGVRLQAPKPADEAALLRVHTLEYLDAIRHATTGTHDHGLNTPDNPVFPHMHDASALVAGASLAAAEAVWRGETTRAVSISGGLHHAMPDRASGFCVYNDPAVAIARLLDLGAERIGYVDVDVHHGDGVQEIFYDDPRVMTISLHETPLALFPGTGYPAETGGPGAEGTAINVALPPGTGDAGWLRAFHAIVPSALRTFRPQVLVTQCGADGHRLDPLADLRLTVDGQRATYLALRDLAEELCGGRWVALGGGGYALVEAVPRAWTHLLAVVTGEPLDPALPIPQSWRALAADRCPDRRSADLMTDGVDPVYHPWTPGFDAPDAIDRSILATRRAVFPLLGLDPKDPRD